jgi:hypothetical protein
MRSTRLQPVGDAEPAGDFTIAEPLPPPPQVARPVSVPEQQMMSLLLRGFGKNALTIISLLFTLTLAGSAFWAWMTVLPQPSTPQLVGLAGYAAFVLILEFVRRR